MSGQLTIRPVHALFAVAAAVSAIVKAHDGDIGTAWLLIVIAAYAKSAAFKRTPAPTGEKE